MKKIIILVSFAVFSLALVSCNKDTLREESVITADKVEYTPFDYWLDANFVAPYNIKFKYRYEEIESDYNYYTVPAIYENAIELAHIVKHVCIEAYDEVAGIEFTRSHFPKLIYLIGTWEFRNNGQYVLGTAEGGKKILLAGVNYLDSYVKSAANLNHFYLKTVHHEFTHILNQNKAYSTVFQFITGTEYVGGEWSSSPYEDEEYYLAHGFISDYAQQEHSEDFAEMLSMYLTMTPDSWAQTMTKASKYTKEWNEKNNDSLPDGATLINSKLDIVRDYMARSWNVDIDKLRAAIQRRQDDVVLGKIDLDDISVK